MGKFLKTGICLLFCISVLMLTAFASDQSSYTVSEDDLINEPIYITLDNPEAEYDAYQILGLQLEQICDHASSEDHTEDCFNHLYSANGKYMKAFYQFAPDMNSDGVFDGTDVVYYVSAIWDDDNLSNEMAELLYEQIQEMELLPDAVIGGTFTQDLDQGYYLLVNADNQTGNFTLLDTGGKIALSLEEKTSAVKVKNYVKANANDQNEEEMELITDEYDGYLGSGTYHTGDTISFKAKYYIDEIKQYPCTIGVDLSGGLEFFNSRQITVHGVNGYQLDSSNSFNITLNDLSEAQRLAVNNVIELAYNVRLSVDAPYRSVSTAYVEYGDVRETSIASVYTYSLTVHCEDDIQFELVNTKDDSLMNFDLEKDAYVFTGIASGKYQLIAYSSGEQIDAVDFSISSMTHKNCVELTGISNSDIFSADEATGIMETVYSDGNWTTVEAQEEAEAARAQSIKTGIVTGASVAGVIALAVFYVLYSERKLKKSKK